VRVRSVDHSQPLRARMQLSLCWPRRAFQSKVVYSSLQLQVGSIFAERTQFSIELTMSPMKCAATIDLERLSGDVGFGKVPNRLSLTGRTEQRQHRARVKIVSGNGSLGVGEVISTKQGRSRLVNRETRRETVPSKLTARPSALKGSV
jgi:hypothetical protein